MEEAKTSVAAASRPPPGSARRRLFWLRVALLGGLFGLVMALLLVLLMRRSGLPPLTADALREAQGRWEAAGPRSYTIEIEVRGAQPATYTARVDAGEPARAARNGIPIKQRRAWETWSVPGMFDTLASDVETLEAQGNLVVRCEFDPRYGYPARYERIELGTGHQVSWQVTQFTAR